MATAGAWSEMEKTLAKPLGATVKRTLEELGFQSMTPVQAATIPLFLAHKVR
jgi:superfamily II DNA/RNA helicase